MLKFTWFIGFCNIIWSRGPLHERGKSLHVTHLEMLAALIIEPCIMTIYGVKINTWPSCLAGTQTFVEVPDQKSPSLVSTASPRAGPRLFLSPARVVLYLLVKWSPCLASICDLHIWCRVLVTNDTHCPHGASLNGVLATCDSGWGYAPALAGVDIKWLEAHVRASSSKSVSALQLGHKKTYDFLCVLRSGARMLGKRSGGGGAEGARVTYTDEAELTLQCAMEVIPWWNAPPIPLCSIVDSSMLACSERLYFTKSFNG